jgi:AcrR family transcriptional regulator
MRIIKKPEIRKAEILDAAEKLFHAKGYEAVTVNDILMALNISKGAFYHYFKSKEEALDEIIEKYIREGVDRAEKIAVSSLSPVQKLFETIMAVNTKNNAEETLILESFNDRDNSKMHKKILTETITRLSPCLAKVIEEGIDAGIFSTSHPNESVQIILTAGIVLFNPDYFSYTKAEAETKATAFLAAMERILGAKPGSFSEFTEAFNIEKASSLGYLR